MPIQCFKYKKKILDSLSLKLLMTKDEDLRGTTLFREANVINFTSLIFNSMLNFFSFAIEMFSFHFSKLTMISQTITLVSVFMILRQT